MFFLSCREVVELQARGKLPAYILETSVDHAPALNFHVSVLIDRCDMNFNVPIP